MGTRALAALCLLVACRYEETQCQEFDYWSGKRPGLRHAIATHDGYNVEWDTLQNGLYSFYSQRVSANGEPISDVRELGAQEYMLRATAPDRELYRRHEYTYELRTVAGDLVGEPYVTDTLGSFATSEGNAFLFASEGQGRRLLLDGSLGTPFPIPFPTEPSYLDGGVISANVTWLVFHRDDTVRLQRLARGGGPLDSSPRVITDQALFFVFAARSDGIAFLTSSRDDTLTFHFVTEAGVQTSVPVEVLPTPSRSLEMIAEPGGYVAIFEDGDPVALRLSTTGAVTDVFDMERFAQSMRFVPGTNNSLYVFEEEVYENEVPTLRTAQLPFGAAPEPSQVLISYDGEIKRRECDCSTGRPTSLLPLLGVLLVLRRAGRLRGSRSESSSARR